MTSPVAKSSLSEPQRELIELFHTVPFGRIENLRVKQGQPFFDPAPRIVQVVKVGGDYGPRPEASLKDFYLKQPLVELFRTLETIGDGEVRLIEIRHGLPHLVEVELQIDRGGSDGPIG